MQKFVKTVTINEQELILTLSQNALDEMKYFSITEHTTISKSKARRWSLIWYRDEISLKKYQAYVKTFCNKTNLIRKFYLKTQKRRACSFAKVLKENGRKIWQQVTVIDNSSFCFP